MFKQLLLTASISLALCTEALAGGVQHIGKRQAQGLSGTPAQVSLHKGYADTLIDFRGIDEYVRQVNLGDNSRILINSDDPTCLSSAAQRSEKVCQAKILYLKQIKATPVEGSYTAPWTTLNVITDSHTYVFRIFYKSGSPEKTIYKVMEDGTDKEGQPSLLDQYFVMRQGYTFGREQGYIPDQLREPLGNFLEAVRGGTTVADAAKQYNISEKAVKKLELLGHMQELEAKQ